MWKKVEYSWRNGRGPNEVINAELRLFETALQPARGGSERTLKPFINDTISAREGGIRLPNLWVKVVGSCLGFFTTPPCHRHAQSTHSWFWYCVHGFVTTWCRVLRACAHCQRKGFTIVHAPSLTHPPLRHVCMRALPLPSFPFHPHDTTHTPSCLVHATRNGRDMWACGCPVHPTHSHGVHVSCFGMQRQG